MDIRLIKSMLAQKAEVYERLSEQLSEDGKQLNAEERNAFNSCIADLIIEDSEQLAFMVIIGKVQDAETGVERIADLVKFAKAN